MKRPDSEQVWRYGSTLGIFVAAAGLTASLSGIGVPSWILWALLLVVCAVMAIRMWPPHLDRAADLRHAAPLPQAAFVDPRAKARQRSSDDDDDDPGV